MNWQLLLTYGYGAEVYGNGHRRMIVNRDTGDIVMEYTQGTEDYGTSHTTSPVAC
ncbi:MAG: hypothetical protein ACOC6S_00655 [Chloroflexota bacterium]